MIATRYAPAVLVLLCLAGVPSLSAALRGDAVVDGRRTALIPKQLASVTGHPTSRTEEWVRRRFDGIDFIERTYGSTRLFVVRSFDFVRLYHHPELAVAYHTGAAYDGVVTAEMGDVRIPVHRIRTPGASTGEGGYVLLYGADRFVEHPYWFHLALTADLLTAARQPMTLFFVYDEAAQSDDPVAATPWGRLLLEAVTSFRAQRAGARP